MSMLSLVRWASSVAAIALCMLAVAYPLDQYERTGIARLEYYRLAQEGEIAGRKLPAGAKYAADAITLAQPELPRDANGRVQLPTPDAELTASVRSFLSPEDRERYGIAVLDYSDPAHPVLALHNGDFHSNVGSVGKVLAGAAVLNELAQIYPDDIAARERVLKETIVVADDYAKWDHHDVPMFDVVTRKIKNRAVVPGDSGNLWEFMDWMFSASSKSAASMVIQHAVLLNHFGDQYPPTAAQAQAWLDSLNWDDEGAVTLKVLTAPMRENGLDPEVIRQGSYFTLSGKRAAAGTMSFATPATLIHLLAMIETGTFIDPWSSQELKRLLYMTQRRIRYASHPALENSAVYFKSGSLYSCKEEPGFSCGKYQGNRRNVLGSLAIVESPERPEAAVAPLRYGVIVISNVLYKNSAVAHQTLAMRIHRLLESRHPAAAELAEASGAVQ